jgi:acetyl esterase/lipase
MKRFCVLAMLAVGCGSAAMSAEPLVFPLWPGNPPGEIKVLPPEADTTKAEDRLIAGRRIIKLGNVSTPQLAVYRAPKEKDTGAAVVICPGGGHNILAYDLEGTEAAEWLNGIGVSAIVLKYRVPFRDPENRSHAAVQDGQRAMSYVRFKAAEWGLDPKRIGMLGFSAGGEVTGLVSILGEQRQYAPADDIDRIAIRPDFAILIYPGGLTERAAPQLRESVKVSKDSPPMFFVHAFDDNVPVQNALLFAAELKKAGGSAEVHVYESGGHGYGLRFVANQPVTTWPKRAEEWLVRRGILRAGR